MLIQHSTTIGLYILYLSYYSKRKVHLCLHYWWCLVSSNVWHITLEIHSVIPKAPTEVIKIPLFKAHAKTTVLVLPFGYSFQFILSYETNPFIKSLADEPKDNNVHYFHSVGISFNWFYVTKFSLLQSVLSISFTIQLPPIIRNDLECSYLKSHY